MSAPFLERVFLCIKDLRILPPGKGRTSGAMSAALAGRNQPY
ncbi:MAG: hypothetical protein ABSA01_01070 [Anaerolineales bacterium]